MKTDYESPLEHSSSPDGCREDCPACEDERRHEAGAAHTPGPWHLIGTSDSGFTIHASLPDDAGDTDILAVCRNGSRDTNEANAAHIVLCVNSHERLVKALERLILWADALESEAAQGNRTAKSPPILEAEATLATLKP